MSKLIYRTLFFYVIVLGNLQAQNNLVLNPSFEQNIGCNFEFTIGLDTSSTNFRFCDKWFAPNTGTSDIYAPCHQWIGAGVPLNGLGYQVPHSGQNYAGILVIQDIYREYLQTRLSQPLKAHQRYLVSFYVSPTVSVLEDVNLFWGVYVNSIGLALTPQRVTNYVSPLTLPLTEVVGNPLSRVLNDTTKWYKMECVYVATGGEQWLTIGNFRPNSDIIMEFARGTMLGNPATSYAYIDDVLVIEATAATTAVLGSDEILCDSSFPYTLSAASDYTNYIWSTGDTTRTIVVNTPGVYTIQVNTADCVLYDTIRLSTSPPPPFILRDTSVCNQNFPIQLNVPSGYSSYIWNDGSTNQSIQVSQTGVYSVTATWACGTVSDAIEVRTESPVLVDLGDSIIYNCLSDGTQAAVTLENSTILPTYLWSTGEHTIKIIVNDGGTYSLSYRNSCGVYSDSVQVMGCPPTLYLPNAFSPDYDGINDEFKVVGRNFDFVAMRIFDRWGQEVFYSTNANDGWDGHYKGKELPVGVYAYKVIYKAFNQSSTKEVSGTVMLIH